MINKIKEIIAMLEGVQESPSPLDYQTPHRQIVWDAIGRLQEIKLGLEAEDVHPSAHDYKPGQIDTNDKPGRGLIAGFVPNPISVYIVLMWAGRTEDAMAKMWADMEKQYPDPDYKVVIDGVEQINPNRPSVPNKSFAEKEFLPNKSFKTQKETK